MKRIDFTTTMITDNQTPTTLNLDLPGRTLSFRAAKINIAIPVSEDQRSRAASLVNLIIHVIRTQPANVAHPVEQQEVGINWKMNHWTLSARVILLKTLEEDHVEITARTSGQLEEWTMMRRSLLTCSFQIWKIVDICVYRHTIVRHFHLILFEFLMRGRNEWDGAFHFQLPGLKKQQKQTNKKQNKTNLTIQIGSIHSEQKSSAYVK